MDRTYIIIIVAFLIGAYMIFKQFRKAKQKGKEIMTPEVTPESEEGEVEKPGLLKQFAKALNLEKETPPPPVPTTGKGKKGGKGGKEEAVTKYAAVDAYVYNDMLGRCGPAVIPGDIVKEIIDNYGTLGRPRIEEDGKSRYQLTHDSDGYKPTFYPYSPDNSSTRLFRAQSHPEIPVIYDVEMEKGLVEKYGIYILFAGIAIFLMWSAVAG